jgi:hypothetical protein
MEFQGLNSLKTNALSLSVKEKAFIFLVLFHFLALLFFGKTYTKMEIVPFLHLHDVLFGLMFVFSLFFKSQERIKPIELLLLFALSYLVVSFAFGFNEEGLWHIYLRQFMLFGYLSLSYFVIKAIMGLKNGLKLLLQLTLLFAVLSAIVQLLFCLWLYFKTGNSPFFIRNYFTPLVVPGLIALAAYCLTSLKNPGKQFAFILLFILSLTFGHDSAYLSLIAVYVIYYFLKASKYLKIGIILFFLMLIAALFLTVTTFTDVNMYWRLIYWGDTLRLMVADGTIFIGRGFGIPYLEQSTLESLNNLVINDKVSFQFPEVVGKYVVPPHNSFVTMVIHLGIFSLAFLIFPLKRLFVTKTLKENKSHLFLLLALVGVSVWSFFNVILELPHSASYFWLIYFSLAFSLKSNEKTETNESAK